MAMKSAYKADLHSVAPADHKQSSFLKCPSCRWTSPVTMGCVRSNAEYGDLNRIRADTL